MVVVVEQYNRQDCPTQRGLHVSVFPSEFRGLATVAVERQINFSLSLSPSRPPPPPHS